MVLKTQARGPQIRTATGRWDTQSAVMGTANGGQAVNAPTGDNESIMRARELEIEVARLNAELETLRGEGEPTDIAARFLTMAASTVDQAMEQARTEADELAAEVSAAAEARRDEATRIADEAEARTESLRAEAANHEELVE